MFISSHNKNPLINFERNDWKQQKPQNFISLNFSLKCMKNENNWKRKGKRVLPVLEDKNPWKKFERKWQKSWLWIWIGRRERKTFWKSWNSDEHMKSLSFLKTLWTIFDWSKIRLDRSKITFDWSRRNWAAIETVRFKPKF